MLAARLAEMREWASYPDAVVWLIKGRVIFPEDVLSRPDDNDLIEFIRAKCAPQNEG